jgi:drug/metabolite transporter (DMT)-like permease
VFYNIIFAGTLANWAWFTLARSLPVAISSMSALPVPVIGVFSGMLLLGERPGALEWAALGLVLTALVAVLWSPRPDAALPPGHDT